MNDYIEQLEATDKEILIERVFIPTADNRPPELKPIVMINDVPILTHQNISAIIASPGSGKSSVCEAICSAAINPNSDNLGFKVSQEITRTLFIDTERVNMDVWNSYDRINRRAETKDSDKSIIVGLRDIPRLEERRAAIVKLIERYEPQLLVIDGAGDMVTDTNSLEQAIECRIWFRELTTKYQLSIMTTLHPNKGTNNPRGHIGAEILREAHAVFTIQTDGDVKTLTNDFTHGKNRNGALISTSYSWNNEAHMFLSCDAPINPTKKIEPHVAMSKEDIIQLVADLTKSKPSASEFKAQLKSHLIANYPRAKRGATAISDFYDWLQVNKYIMTSGTAAMKIVQAFNGEQTKIDI